MELAAAGRSLAQVWRETLPVPGPGQVRIRVAACGVCRTDLHLVDGDLPHPGHPVVPGHEIVGRVDALGEGVDPCEIEAGREREQGGAGQRERHERPPSAGQDRGPRRCCAPG